MFNRIAAALAVIILLIAAALLAYTALSPRLAAPAEASGNALLPAQQTTVDSNTGITVSGVGKVRVKPNIATASIGVEITAPTLADATSQANIKATALIDKLKSLGVAEKDIQTVNYNVTPLTQQPKDGSTPKVTGYRVNNQFSVTIRNLGDAGKILDAVVTAGANNIYGITFGVDDPSTYQQQARAAAIKDAQDKANQLAKAANITLGKVIAINEGTVSQPVFRGALDMAMPAAAPEVPVQTGELEIDVNVSMRFAVQ